MKEREILRERLARNHLTFVWLINQLADKGIETEKSELSSVFAGTRKGNKADKILSASEEILTDYEKNFANS